VRELLERKTGADDARLQLRAFADAQARVVEERAAAAACGEKIVTARIVNYALSDDATMLERDRNSVVRKAMKKIRRTVERIDDPAMLGCPGRSAFLC